MALKKSSSQRTSGPKGSNRKTAPREFFSDQTIRSQGQKSQLKKKSKKGPSWK